MSDNTQANSRRIVCRQLLKPCCSKPNCVSSLAPDDDSHFIEPISLSAEPARDWQRLIEVVSAIPRTLIVVQQSGYIHAECKSRLFGFVDDLELCCDMTARVCHLRSASRSGYYDFNVNKKRIDTIRRALSALQIST